MKGNLKLAQITAEYYGGQGSTSVPALHRHPAVAAPHPVRNAVALQRLEALEVEGGHDEGEAGRVTVPNRLDVRHARLQNVLHV